MVEFAIGFTIGIIFFVLEKMFESRDCDIHQFGFGLNIPVGEECPYCEEGPTNWGDMYD